MFRETDDLERVADTDQSVWPVVNRNIVVAEPVPAVVDEALAFRAAPAAPDVPSSVGVLLFAIYAALIGALALATAGGGQSILAIVIASFFVLTFFTVPYLIFRQEPREGRRPAMEEFLEKGLATHTGHCGGGAALVQMLIVPGLLTIGVLMIAVEIAILG